MYRQLTGSGGGEKRTGTALPIFPRKRPRMALMAFSNSQSSNDHVTQHRRQDKSSFVFTAAESKENSGSYNRSGKETTKWSAYKPAVSGHVTVAPATVQPHSSTSYWDDTRDLDVTKDSSGGIISSATNDHVMQAPVQRDHVMQSQLMKSVHLLTATSQGVQHWAGYQQHISLMFEVFGTLSSLVERGEMGAMKFTLQAVDGPLSCLFWEIDYKIPASLTRGRLCRAVGKWDTHKAVLKCVSIRLADSNEWNSVKTMVATSDKYMRQMASSLNEI